MNNPATALGGKIGSKIGVVVWIWWGEHCSVFDGIKKKQFATK